MAGLQAKGGGKFVVVVEQLLEEMHAGGSLKRAIVADDDIEKMKALVDTLVDALAEAIFRAKEEWRTAVDKGHGELAGKLKDAVHELTLLIIVLGRDLIEFIDSQDEVKKAVQKMKEITQEAEQVKASTAQSAKFMKEFKSVIDSVAGLIKLVNA